MRQTTSLIQCSDFAIMRQSIYTIVSESYEQNSLRYRQAESPQPRLPRKPLLPIQGKPMIQWTYENAIKCPLITETVVATDSQEIADLIHQIGGKAIMTDPNIATGSERVAAVAALYPEMDVVINLQGDEPFIKPSMLEKLVAPYLAGDAPEMTTLAITLHPDKYTSAHQRESHH